MPDNNFFGGDGDGGSQGGDANPEPSKIKLEDSEYTVDELKEFVKYGKLGKEVETKHNTKLDRLMPEYTKSTQRVKELEEALTKAQQEAEGLKASKAPESDELTPEQKTAAIRQLKDLGIVTKEDADFMKEVVQKEIQNTLAVRDLKSQIEKSIKQYKDEYGIEATVEDVANYMADSGTRSPDDALYLHFREQIEKSKQKKWLESKAPEFRTLSQQSLRKEPISPDFKDRNKVKKMALEQMLGGDH